MKHVRTSSGSLFLYPKRIYCYQSPVESLKDLISRPGFIPRCQLWRTRSKDNDVYSDVYDGTIWHTFSDFHTSPTNFCLALNCDWFQPYKHQAHSVGALYLVIQNLPREDRYMRNENLIDSGSFDLIQERVDSITTPPDMGRIPLKISSGFSSITADQWKNWTLYYSLYSLKGVLSFRHYNCWHLFVKACHLLCRRKISCSDVKVADSLIIEFCETYEQLYGSKHCTPNLHLVCHLAQCVHKHGPLYAFWLFSFERMNGILSSFQTSNQDITIQIMRKFTSTQESSITMARGVQG